MIPMHAGRLHLFRTFPYLHGTLHHQSEQDPEMNKTNTKTKHQINLFKNNISNKQEHVPSYRVHHKYRCNAIPGRRF